MKIKLVWYNILRGFHKKEENGSFTFEEKRLNGARKIISELNPDILFLGEADFNPLNTLSGKSAKKIDYAKIFNYPYFFYSFVTERKGEAVLSKFPIVAKSSSTEMFSLIESNWNMQNKKIKIDIIHPYPKIPEKEKAERIKKILRKVRGPFILLGDFNALSPQDIYSIEELTEGFRPARGDGARENAIDAAQCLMIKEVINADLIDTFRAKNEERGDTFPTQAFSPFKEKGYMRLDYIFCSKEFKILESGIIKNKLADVASDHYPIYAVLELR
jgi:endonuclease/exonuclease/phosphatase family metal-dependent hydrolase